MMIGAYILMLFAPPLLLAFLGGALSFSKRSRTPALILLAVAGIWFLFGAIKLMTL